MRLDATYTHSRRPLLMGLLACLPSLVVSCGDSGTAGSTSGNSAEAPYEPRPQGSLTFNKHIAPIIFDNCSTCHRPDGGAPFDLLTYDQVRRRSGQIAHVTEDRYMPPWMPTRGRGDFTAERTLTATEIGMIAQWSDEGSIEGAPEDLPPAPVFAEGWTLGTPDLVLELPEAYELPADGADVYRNFVLEVPLERSVYVRTFEFDPGNARVVHHALMQLDPTRESRRLDAESPEPGFGNLTDMELPSTVVNSGDGGFFHGWNPGARAFEGYEDMAWPLDSSFDMVLQLHMRPSGKPEKVRPKVALYFADSPPKRFPLVIGTRAPHLDIPAGEKNYVFEEQYTLPVDVDVLAIALHAHYIGKELQGFADLPDGSRKWLAHIADWDFNWQEGYRYTEPVFLPKGTRITQRFSYDNSAANPRNPASPPQRVRGGGSSLDEMGELWIQVLPRKPGERKVLKHHHLNFYRNNEARGKEDNFTSFAGDVEEKALLALQANPSDWTALLDMARCRGFENRTEEAIDYARRATEAAPNEAEAHCMLGHLLIEGNTELAIEHLARAISIQPDLGKAHFSLGLAWKRRGSLSSAEQSFARAHQLTPEDPLPPFNLGLLAAQQGRGKMAVQMFQKTLQIEPRFKPARQALNQIQGRR